MTITQEQRLQLIGLLTLAKEHNHMLRQLEAAARRITRDEECGHTSDAIYCGDEADDLLSRLNIDVV